MSLDKWIKQDKKTANKEKKKPKGSKTSKKESIPEQKNSDKISIKKHFLTCSKKGCDYQRTLMKRQLSNLDKTCPKCGGIMKEKKI